jgi:hypothetical protein
MDKWLAERIKKREATGLAAVEAGGCAPPVYVSPAGKTGTAYHVPKPYKRLLTDMTSAQRKEYPLVTGCIDYFPDALALVSHVSYKGNQKHNPGQKLHHARGKSSDHLDCIGRHLTERKEIDPDTQIIHMANEVWRSLAELQEMLEKKYGLSLPYGATAPGVEL